MSDAGASDHPSSRSSLSTGEYNSTVNDFQIESAAVSAALEGVHVLGEITAQGMFEIGEAMVSDYERLPIYAIAYRSSSARGSRPQTPSRALSVRSRSRLSIAGSRSYRRHAPIANSTTLSSVTSMRSRTHAATSISGRTSARRPRHRPRARRRRPLLR